MLFNFDLPVAFVKKALVTRVKAFTLSSIAEGDMAILFR